MLENVTIKAYNNASILKTIKVKDAPIPHLADLDIGPPLKSLYFYSDDEVRKLVDNEALCSLFAPLLASLLREIISIRDHDQDQANTKRQAQKDKEKDVDVST
ncbi:hypothetical protein C0992_003653 [Termitomyces sp. T32_za158]|nr:hypothetical protein C0992_003653 [Termitomyces sp. T32_za158]